MDPVDDRDDLIPLKRLAGLTHRTRKTVWTWWRYGLRDRRAPKKRVKLDTCLNGGERCTTLAAYRDFCEARDRARSFGEVGR